MRAKEVRIVFFSLIVLAAAVWLFVEGYALAALAIVAGVGWGLWWNKPWKT